MRLLLLAASCALPLAAGMAGAAPAMPASTTDRLGEFLRRPQYESLTLSPRGDYLAARVPLDDRTVLVVVRRSDMQIAAQLDPGKDGFVDSETWVSDTRLFASTSVRWGTRDQPYSLGVLRSLDVDNSKGRAFAGNVIDALVDDPERMLISDCRKVTIKECWTRVVRVSKDGAGKREEIVDAPIPNADFLADRKGTVRFSWAWETDDRQQVYLLRGEEWTQINDETISGVEVLPVGTSYDGRYGYLWSERKQGPDVIERIDLASGERSVVASDPDSDPQRLVWSFDGHEPIGAVYGGLHPKARFFDASHPHAALTADMETAFPGEFARVTSATRDGRSAVVTVSSPREPDRYYLLDTASGDLKLLAKRRPWLTAAQMAPTRAIELKTRDGVVLRGWLTAPTKSHAAPLPLVVMPHGGPFDIQDDWGYDDEVQMLATRGYAVLRVNFRGSGGRGRDFVESGHRQWGAKMIDDLNDATRWAIADAGVDAERICLWGASYGGYAALMAAAREPDLYRCAIGFAGPYDLPTMHRWGDVQRSRWGRAYLDRTLGDDMAELRRQSPTAHAAKIKADLMLVQGMRDERVSPEHLRMMKRALEEAGKPYEGYFPSQETHGFYGEKSKRQYYERVLGFLDKHLR
ncbi:S9 family peptidase [Lysobacter sp. Root916]|uniref:alpha/beta hydrolase family protein n=1 Tax=Lysobacter sp. Root916 TaxID=1736606 RepID=UPI0009E9EB10|nr:S9 family peptidase [Lysobacter sp. Root916]